jgi:SecD/SecF fusion protein
MRRASFATIANVSLWETMRRSLATTFITLLPIASLLLFGGETLKDFAFALFVGIGLGAVSTFFVATPFLTVLMERSPEFRGRIGADVMEKGVGGAVAVQAPAQAEIEPAPAPERVGAPAMAAPPGDGAAPRQSKREQRRQRRRSRPHGRAR